MAETKRLTGTKEWSDVSANCVLGCTHRCRYCYARAIALRFNRITDPGAWGTTYNGGNLKALAKRWKNVGTVMFPTTHDITPEFLGPCLTMIGNILDAGNRILIVSKPHLECIAAICKRFGSERDRITFRFSIGSADSGPLWAWEPGAPGFVSREDCLVHAFVRGFETSVSCEPLLVPGGRRHAEKVRYLFDRLEPHVTDTIWIGKLNQIDQRVIPGTDPALIAGVKAGQTDEAVRRVYEALRHEPKVRWKDSYQMVLRLNSAKGMTDGKA